MTDLNELFEQILHSEQKFKARVDGLRLVGLEAEKCQACIHQVKEDNQSKRGELAIKSTKLANQEVEVQVHSIRKEILTNQRDTLLQENCTASKKALEAGCQYESDHAAFIEELAQFSQYYDLLGSGVKNRHKDLKKEHTLLQEEILLLEAELVEMNCQEEEVNKLQSELIETENKLLTANNQLTELSKAEQSIQREGASLEQEKEQSLNQEPEFVRLQKELELCKQSTRETTCQQLSTELDELQRQYYHKQMKQQLMADPQHATAGSSRSSGHYNPYTLRYVPAPNPPPLTMDVKPKNPGTNTDDPITTGDRTDTDWTINLNEDDIIFSDDDFPDFDAKTVQKVPTGKQLPSSNFHLSAKPHLVASSSNEFRPSSLLCNQPPTLQPDTLSNNPTPLLTKRQGESIKQTRPTDSEFPKRVKKVRFRY